MVSASRHLTRKPAPPLALILGTNEIASAVAVRLHRAGHAVVMCHDPGIPTIRRGMAFYDAAFGDHVVVGGLSSVLIETTIAARAVVQARERIAVTRLGVPELIVIGSIDALIDARMHKHALKPDLRNLARVTVGLGPGFTVGQNCDVAVETLPARTGLVVVDGQTLPPDGKSRDLGGVGRERFVYSAQAGRWRTALDIGKRVFKGFPLGRVGEQLVTAPMDGILRGIARDDVEVPAGVKLIELDPRGQKAQWVGLDARGRTIAAATLRAVVGEPASRRLRTGRHLKLVTTH